MASRIHISRSKLLEIYLLVDLGVPWASIIRKYSLVEFSRSAMINHIKLHHELYKARHEPASYMAKYLPEGHELGMLGHSDKKRADVARALELMSESITVGDLTGKLYSETVGGNVPKDFEFKGYYPVGCWRRCCETP